MPLTIILAADITLKGSHENPLHIRIDLAIVMILVFLLPYLSS